MPRYTSNPHLPPDYPMEPMEMATWAPERENRVWNARLTRLAVAVSGLAIVIVLFGVLRWAGGGA